MPIILWILVALCALIALRFAHYHLIERRIRPHLPPDEWRTVQTADGWQLELGHIRAALDKPRAPVLCLPGLACNAALFDLNADRSLARALASRGYDLWLLNTRGAGRSDHADNKKRLFTYALEEYAFQDAVAAAKFIVEQTGRPVYLLGHSMGGLIADLAAATLPASQVAGLICIASPFDFSHHQDSLGVYFPMLRWLVKHNLTLPLGPLARLFAPFYSHLLPMSLTLHSKSIEQTIVRQILSETVETPTPKMFREFLEAIDHKTTLSAFADTPLQIAQPVLTLAGDFDRLAPPPAVLALHSPLPQAEHRAFSPMGHLDIVVGREAPAQVYPQIADWLDVQTDPQKAASQAETWAQESHS